MNNVNAVITIAYRDVLKFLRDRGRLIAMFIFPAIFIVVLGKSLQTGVGMNLPFDLLTFTFTGVLAQTLFQSAAGGIVSMIEDRENDFSQELFITPISRYAIIIGKIVGESVVALCQAVAVLIIGFIIGANISLVTIISIIPILALACIFGASFGVVVIGNISSQKVANQVFPFILFPQFFLAGVFAPINNLPIYLDILSKIAPMTYIVDLLRNIYYAGSKELPYVTVFPIWLDLLVVGGMTVLFIALGTFFFVRNEKNR
jgi:ABC-2 type transport system permease protein